MSAISNMPSTINFLSPLNFKFTIKRAINVNFFVQKINIPSLTLPNVDVPSQLINIVFPGDHLEYGDLELSFKVDENLQNYLEIHNWIRALGKLVPGEYTKLSSNASYTGSGIRSDLVLNVLNSSRIANYEIVFHDAIPIRLSSLNFDTTLSTLDFLEASCNFKYTYYDINKTT
jgi:hypothetical protein